MKQILIVDDSISLAHALAACLVGGYEVAVSHGGAEALARAETLPGCDLLVTDYQMPDMNGAELAVRFRQRYPEAKVLLLTGFGEELDLSASPAGPVDSRLDKPFGPTELREAVRALIGT